MKELQHDKLYSPSVVLAPCKRQGYLRAKAPDKSRDDVSEEENISIIFDKRLDRKS
jgi:hypothetical protein